ncbi:hypothetical protein CFBP5875_04640 [Agrobacterium pusense]|uniref:hypothetical protein n=1 Tax=Agrobacterium pusense TaxID=648995 RepID=UPI0010BE8A24|nr:hypothetical protein [Agrobacterium pusense]QCL83906.1 hypothetical protein CFBP5875_04640 [Agrobacterium pusense]
MSEQSLNEFLTQEAERMANEVVPPADDTAKASDDQVSTPADNAPEEVSTPGEEGATQEATAQPAEAVEQLEAPKHWDAADRETFAKMSPDAQKWALKRDKQVEATITKKTQELAEQRKAVEPLLAAQQREDPYLKSIGVTPDVAFATLIATEKLLRMGTPAQKSQAIAKLIQDYQIDLNQPPAADPQPNNNQPADTRLHDEVQQLKQSLNSMTSQQVASQVDAFAATKDASGALLYPHFEAVRVKMGQMVATGDSRPLPELYAEAIWAVPEVRETILEDQRRAAATAQTEKAREAAAKARAASNVNVKPGGSNGTARPKLSLREEIEELARQQA